MKLGPTRYQARTLSVSPERYQALVRMMAMLITEAEAEEDSRAEPARSRPWPWTASF